MIKLLEYILLSDYYYLRNFESEEGFCVIYIYQKINILMTPDCKSTIVFLTSIWLICCKNN